MKILSIESSGLVASVAIVEDDTLVAEYTTNFKKTHSETLLPMLSEIKDRVGLDLGTVDAIAVSSGPGSFTGLRIGSSTAKGLGFAMDVPIIPVSTVDGLAYNCWGAKDLVCPIMDARRNQVYTGVYSFAQDKMETVKEPCAIGIDEIVSFLNEKGQAVIFLGDGVPVFSDYIAENLTVPYSFAPAHMNKQRAAAVATLGMSLYKEGKYQTAAEHRPEYLRMSQAERERLEKEKLDQGKTGQEKND